MAGPHVVGPFFASASGRVNLHHDKAFPTLVPKVPKRPWGHTMLYYEFNC